MTPYERNLAITKGCLRKASPPYPILVKTGKKKEEIRRKLNHKLLHKESRKCCMDLLANKPYSFLFRIGHFCSKIHHCTKEVLRRPLRNYLKVQEKPSHCTEKAMILTGCTGKVRGSITNVCKITSGVQKAFKICFSSSFIIDKEWNI